MKKGKLNSLVLIALFSAIISVSAFISIPFITLPITMQSLAIALSLFLLGGRRGTLSVLLYVLIGLVGVPVFSGFQGGVGAIGGVGGGFIIGFILEALIFWLAEVLFGKRDSVRILGYLTGHILLYISGAVWYFLFFVAKEGFFTVLLTVVLPYIVPDIIKFLVAFLIFRKINKKIRL